MDSLHAGDKRPAPAAVPDQTVPLDGVHAVVVDVEGTTSPASFTKVGPCRRGWAPITVRIESLLKISQNVETKFRNASCQLD